MSYTKVNWENIPSKGTPMSAENLNHMDDGIADVDYNLAIARSDLTTLEGRVDEIAQAPEGSTTGDLELIDGRTDPYGDSYTNIGTAIRTQLSKATNNFAPAYVTTNTYNDGDYVTYKGGLYKCAAYGVTGTWDATKWVGVSGIPDLAETMVEADENLQSEIDAHNYFGEASGEIVTVEEAANVNARALVVGINPVQDLHGYDHPWLGGGGKNLLNIPDFSETLPSGITFSCVNGVVTVNGTASSDLIYNIVPPRGGASEYSKISNIFDAQPGVSYVLNGSIGGGRDSQWLQLLVSGSGNEPYSEDGDSSSFSFTQEEIESQYRRIAIRIASGTVLNNVKFYPMIRLASVTDPTWSPYSNICPISGWTGVDIADTGKNIWDEEWELGNIQNETGEPVSASNRIRCKNFIPVKENAQYYFYCGAGVKLDAFAYDKDKNFLGYWTGDGWIKGSAGSADLGANVLTTPTNCYFIKIKMITSYGTTYNHDISINYPATDNAYHPYVGHTTQIQLPTAAGTVYAGELNVTTGELVVDKKYVDLGTLDWTESCPALAAILDGKTYSGSTVAPWISDTFKISSQNNWNYGCISGIDWGARVAYWNHSGEDPADVKTMMSGKHLLYELATPVTYHLSPTQIKLLLGLNNIWANSGPIRSLEYVIDPKFILKDEFDKRAIVDTSEGAIVSIPDAVKTAAKNVTVDIEPVQDLHGYDHPWPAGGGKNLLPITPVTYEHNGITFTARLDGTILVTGTATDRADFNIYFTVSGGSYIINGVPNGAEYNNNYWGVLTRSNPYESYGAFIEAGLGPIELSSGYTYVYGLRIGSGYVCPSGGLLYKPMVRLSTETDGSFAPYSNICPISGWTVANVWDDPKYGRTVTWNQLIPKTAGSVTGVTNNGDGTFTVDSAYDNYYVLANFELIKNHVYFAYLKNGIDNYLYLRIENSSGNAYSFKTEYLLKETGQSILNQIAFIRARSVGSIVTVAPQLFDLTSMFGSTIADYIYSLEQSTPGAGVAWFHNLFPKDYYAYNIGEETCVSAVNGDPYLHYPIAFPSEAGTVYGGTLDVTNGVLTVTMASVQIKDVGFGYYSDYNYFGKYISFNGNDAGYICSSYMSGGAKTDSDMSSAATGIYNWGSKLKIKDSRYSDIETFIADMGDEFIVYELATPITYHLTPTEVKLLAAKNNVWADTGDTSLAYEAHPKLYIEKLTAPTEDDMVANNTIASGTYFMIGNKLYLSTTTIPAGDTINPGSNCTLTSLAEALNAIN